MSVVNPFCCNFYKISRMALKVNVVTPNTRFAYFRIKQDLIKFSEYLFTTCAIGIQRIYFPTAIICTNFYATSIL